MIWGQFANIGATFGFGLFFAWAHRKLVARMQGRVGPPPLQPLYDIIKLLSKQRIRSAADFFVFLSLVFIMMAASLMPVFDASGDAIMVAASLAASAVMFALVGFATRSPYTVIGASRGMQQTFFIELSFLALILGSATFAHSTDFVHILAYQAANPMSLVYIAGFLLSIPVMQAKLGLKPFDIEHAESEIMAGAATELSGLSLAMHEVIQVMEVFLLPFIMVSMFLHTTLVVDIAVSFLVLVLLSLIEATNTRLRPDQAGNALLAVGGASVLMLALGGLL